MPHLEFRYLKNVAIDLGDGRSYNIPFRMELSDNPACETKVPVFNLKVIHPVPLLDERPDLPDRGNMDDDMYRELTKDAWVEAAENRKKNKSIRKAIAAYVESGSIELVSDDFATKKVKREEPVVKPTPTPAVTETAPPKGEKPTVPPKS